MKKFVVVFHANNDELNIEQEVVFGPFVDKKFAESFIYADIEAGKNFMDQHCHGYGRETKWNNIYILPSYGEWKIMELIEPFGQNDYSEHCSDF